MGRKSDKVGNVPGLGMENTLCPSCKKTIIERTGFSVKSNRVGPDNKCGLCGGFIAGRF